MHNFVARNVTVATDHLLPSIQGKRDTKALGEVRQLRWSLMSETLHIFVTSAASENVNGQIGPVSSSFGCVCVSQYAKCELMSHAGRNNYSKACSNTGRIYLCSMSSFSCVQFGRVILKLTLACQQRGKGRPLHHSEI